MKLSKALANQANVVDDDADGISTDIIWSFGWMWLIVLFLSFNTIIKKNYRHIRYPPKHHLFDLLIYVIDVFFGLLFSPANQIQTKFTPRKQSKLVDDIGIGNYVQQ